MATIHISDETYQRLARQAADQQTTVDQLIEPALRKIASDSTRDSTAAMFAQNRRNALAEWMDLVEKRSSRYPSAFIVDDRRENIYAGRGE